MDRFCVLYVSESKVCIFINIINVIKVVKHSAMNKVMYMCVYLCININDDNNNNGFLFVACKFVNIHIHSFIHSFSLASQKGYLLFVQ